MLTNTRKPIKQNEPTEEELREMRNQENAISGEPMEDDS